MSKHHRLKSWPQFYWPAYAGAKRFEVRRNDRNFKVGDTVDLCEWEPVTGEYTGQEFTAEIVYLFEPGADPILPGIEPGFCVFGLESLEAGEPRC